MTRPVYIVYTFKKKGICMLCKNDDFKKSINCIMTNKTINNNYYLDPKIWGPHYWFVLHTIAITYPLCPNDVTKKKYYDFIQSLPLFLPVNEIGDSFSKFIDKYPVTPYLDSRESFVRWMHFIHNKINTSIGIPEMEMDAALEVYYSRYQPRVEKDDKERLKREKIIFIAVIIISSLIAILLYSK